MVVGDFVDLVVTNGDLDESEVEIEEDDVDFDVGLGVTNEGLDGSAVGIEEGNVDFDVDGDVGEGTDVF